jgi:rubrerythrin
MNVNHDRTQSATRRSQAVSRRAVLATGAMAGVAGGLASAFSMPLFAGRADAATTTTKRNDAKILNNALFYEHQAIWAYSFAAGKLTNTDVGKAVLEIALANQADHKKHRDLLTTAVQSLGGVPVKAEASYDVSAYIQKGEGNIDSDVNIAKLALALETDAAIAYTTEIAALKTPALITVGASIGSTESAHATAIRAAFNALGVKIPIVPASFINAQTRDVWILKV